jgi:hypothetical protein
MEAISLSTDQLANSHYKDKLTRLTPTATGQNRYTEVLLAFVVASRRAVEGDSMPDGWYFEDESEILSALPTFDRDGRVDGINVYRGVPRSDRRIGWYSFGDTNDFLEFAEKMRSGFTVTVLRSA